MNNKQLHKTTKNNKSKHTHQQEVKKEDQLHEYYANISSMHIRYNICDNMV